jgi:hypothetical protein
VTISFSRSSPFHGVSWLIKQINTIVVLDAYIVVDDFH